MEGEHTMKPETIEKIRVILRDEVAEARLAMMRAIEGGEPHAIIDDKIAEYKKIYDTLRDFYEWVNENESEGEE